MDRTAPAATSGNRLTGLDALRLLAAAGVMIAHYGDMLYPRWTLVWHLLGALCVNVFFVISGLVIMISAQAASSGRQFLARRASRLYPAFLVCMLFTVLVKYKQGIEISSVEFIANLTMIPTILNVTPVAGAYWTLAHEWSFYVMVAAVFTVVRRNCTAIMVSWVVISAVMQLTGSDLGALNIIANVGFAPLFAAGMFLHLVRTGQLRLAPAVAIGATLMAASAGGSWGGPLWPGVALSAAYLLCFAFCVGLVAALAAIELPPSLSRIAIIGGAASYPLYLVHAPVGRLLFPVLSSIGLGAAGVMAGSMLAAVVLSVATSQWIEAPARRLLVCGIGRVRLICAAGYSDFALRIRATPSPTEPLFVREE